ncbi:hypothetical protein HOH87_08540 [bacterium]|jgi:hypothetical protein|nr:hypothetical protein [bacterium]
MMYSVIPFLSAIYFLVLGGYVLSKGWQCRKNITFFLLGVTTFFWQVSIAVLFYVSNPELAYIAAKSGYFIIFFLPTCFFHFLVEVSEENQNRKWVYLSYSIAALMALLDMSNNLFVSGIYSYPWGYYPKAGLLHPFHVLQTCTVASWGLYVVYKKSQRVKNPLKVQLRYTVVALLIYFLAALDYLGNYGVEIFPPGIFFITASLTIMVYAITKHELMDIRLGITRSVSYGMVSIVLVGSFIAVLVSSSHLIFQSIGVVVLGLFWAKCANRIRLFIQTPLDKKWVRGWYDEKELLNHLIKALAGVGDRESLIKTVIGECQEYIGIRRIVCLHPIPDQVIRFVLKNSDVSRMSRFSDDLKDVLDQNTLSNKSILMPIFLQSGLEAVFVFDEKLSEDPYTEDDLKTLSTIQAQVGIIFDRIRPYEQIKLELEKTHTQRVQLETIVKTVVTLHHEVLNPLTAIKTIAYTLKSAQAPDQLLKYAEMINEASDRIVKVLKEMETMTEVQETPYANNRSMIVVPGDDD